MPAHYDPLAPTLAGVQNVNPTSSGTQFADDEVEDYEDDEGELGHNPPPHDFQLGSNWHDPNQGWYYQPPQYYLSPDPVVQSAFDQEHYAAQLANYYQLLAEQKAAHAEQENEQLRQTLRQQSVLQNQSQLSAPTQSSMPTAAAMLAGPLGSQTAASAAPPILTTSHTTIPAAKLPEHTYLIYCLAADQVMLTHYVDPRVQQSDMSASTQLHTDLSQSMLDTKAHDAKQLHKLHIKTFDSASKAWSKWQQNFDMDMLSAEVQCTSWVTVVTQYHDDPAYKAYEHWTMWRIGCQTLTWDQLAKLFENQFQEKKLPVNAHLELCALTFTKGKDDFLMFAIDFLNLVNFSYQLLYPDQLDTIASTELHIN